MKFVDHIEIRVRSGSGGAGMSSFKSAKNKPKLGADGGDGGFGGHVFLEGDHQLNTLSSLYYKRLYKAEDGERGGTNGKTGRNGEDMLIPVPVGTVAYDKDTGDLLGEVLEDGQRICLAEGGKRGLGNMRYVSSKRQAPEDFTSGGPGVEIRLGLELKVIADVGLAGFPNAGKSTFLSAISAARPKIADYPFTTLQPQLGVIDLHSLTGSWGESFVVADIPGLIEGASEGKGLGLEFLRHLERTKVIMYVVDPHNYEGQDPLESFKILRSELETYGHGLSEKEYIVVLSKADTFGEGDKERFSEGFLKEGIETLAISSVSGIGLKELQLKLWELVSKKKQVIAIDKPVMPNDDDAKDEQGEYEAVVKADDDDLLGF